MGVGDTPELTSPKGELRGRRGLTPVYIAAKEAHGTEYQGRGNLSHERRADSIEKSAEGREAQTR